MIFDAHDTAPPLLTEKNKDRLFPGRKQQILSSSSWHHPVGLRFVIHAFVDCCSVKFTGAWARCLVPSSKRPSCNGVFVNEPEPVQLLPPPKPKQRRASSAALRCATTNTQREPRPSIFVKTSWRKEQFEDELLIALTTYGTLLLLKPGELV